MDNMLNVYCKKAESCKECCRACENKKMHALPIASCSGTGDVL